ncbi:promotilin [Falco rusticolus]|uniref:promotilin n=1 Tax=Falco rusticolus TaxID=120794 RepID=UPI001886714F|nr:promotilin [Falco rusticolus]
MVSKVAPASLLLVYTVSMLAEQTEGFVPFFTQSNFQKMQEKGRERGKKNPLALLQQLEEKGSSEQSGADVNKVRTIQLADPVRAGMWLTPRQLEKYQDVLEKLLAETLQDTPDGTVRRLISAFPSSHQLIIMKIFIFLRRAFVSCLLTLQSPQIPHPLSCTHSSGKVIHSLRVLSVP